MTTRTIILRSVRFYWRTHLGVILGAALGALVLTGALLVGDSVKATLVRQALARVGKADVAMTGGDRFFRAALADAAGSEAAPILMLRATVARADGAARVNVAQLLGVDARFWKLSPSGATVDLPHDGVALNARLAQQLDVAAGDTVIVRVEKPGMFSRDAPLSGEEADIVALRVKVARIVDDEHYGRFALTASQVPPFTVFVPISSLQEKIGKPAEANLLLNGLLSFVNWSDLEAAPVATEAALRARSAAHFKAIYDDNPYRSPQRFTAMWKDLLTHQLTLADAQLSLLEPNNSGLELRTSRVFLDPPIVAAAPPGKDDRRVDSLTYFVNAIEAKSESQNPKSEIPSTPYSMVTAIETPSSGFLPAELADDEIVITQWLADDLGIGPGAKVTLKYFVMGERRQLEEMSREFTVLAVLPMSEPQLNSSWMPDFPGLKDAKNCRDWKPGFEIDMTKMRAKDNDYWEQFRGTPKAFVNLKAGQEMWGNRWGNVTSLRWPAGTDRAEIEKALREKLTPEMLGFQFIPLREQALAATKAPVDFGELFVSFSFFLIVAAAVLTGLLFVFTLEQRNAEAGTLLALGLPPRLVRRMFLLEGAILAFLGSVLGAACAVVYTKLVLRALATVWRGAVGAVEFEFALPSSTLAIGVASGVSVALLAMWLASRKQMRHSARELLSGVTEENVTRRKARGASQSGREAAPPRWRCTGQTEAGDWASQVPTSGAGRGGGEESRGSVDGRENGGLVVGSERTSAPSALPPSPGHEVREHRAWLPYLVGGFGFALLAVGLALFGGKSPAMFFGAGALLLIAGLLLALVGLRAKAHGASLENLAQLGVRNATRRRGRSLATIAVLASGVFMVVAVDSFRHGPNMETEKRDSGTGGFALIGESALPIYEDLNTEKGREAYGLDEKIMDGVNVVQMRVRDGDDASCLNLNRATQPRVLGVNPIEFDEPSIRFHLFAPSDDGIKREWATALANRYGTEGYKPWATLADTDVPGVVDANTLQWAMQKKVGDAIEYQDERGSTFRVVIVGTVKGSMLQGNILIAEKNFIERFPGAGGYRSFLIDCPREKVAAVREHLSRQLADRGLELTTTAQRLAEFNAVENTYLSIFQVLGGLGLLLGSAGLAIVIARNVLERRSEFGLLEAVGFRHRQLRKLVFAEHRWLIVCGLVIGTISALVAVWPNLREKASGFPYLEMALLLAGLLAGCVFWAWLATRLALRGSQVEALRAE